MNKQKGFTIIELIVVIAIIAVLAAIVLVNVTGYITKGKVAAEKGNLSGLATAETVYYDGAGSYLLGTVSAAYTTAVTSAGGTIDQSGVSGSTGWCIKATLSDATIWCVDGTGYSGTTSTNCTSATSTSCQ